MTKDEKLLTFAKEHIDSFTTMLEQLVRRESPSHEDKIKSDQCGEYIIQKFNELGFRTERIHQCYCGDHLYGEIGSGEESVLLLGHYDTVFPIGSIAKDMPFRMDAKKVYGPGVLDMKGGIAMAYLAVKALQALSLLPGKKIGFFFSSDEESGSIYSRDLIIEKAKKYKNVLVMEPGNSDENSVKTARAAKGVYTITATGKAGHSGTNPQISTNPIVELSMQIERINKWNIDNEDITYTPIHFEGGEPGRSVIPENSSFTLDVRAKKDDLYSIADKRIQMITPYLSEVSLKVEGGLDRPMMNADLRLFERAKHEGKNFGLDLEGIFVGGGSDGNFTSSAGVPTLDGLGMVGDFIHNVSEYAFLDAVPRRTALVAKLMHIL